MGDGGVIALPAMININFCAILPSRQIITPTIIHAIFFFPFARETNFESDRCKKGVFIILSRARDSS